MKIMTVNTSKSYDILIKNGCGAACGEYIRKRTNASKAFIITDSNVLDLYADTVKSSLLLHGFDATVFSFPAGETNKTLTTISTLLNAMADAQITRGDIVIALGGGVVGDMAGFAASVYLRGISFVQIPTSLLAMVDSSVGGKTGCDLPAGKNLVGSFWQPELVLIDPQFLLTLPKRYYNDGLAEVIKAGCIKSASLFDNLENKLPDEFLEEMIYECVNIKRIVVEADEREIGERKLLNFGHTLGHAIEKYHNFEGFSHGEAVAIGMVAITLASEKAGLTMAGTAERITKLLSKYNLPVTPDAELKHIIPYCFTDKKRDSDKISIVLLKNIGESFIYKIGISELAAFLEGQDEQC